jgi:hypothetical protein
MWKKAGEIRREVQMVIAPIYNEVVRENCNKWTKQDMVAEAKHKYYKKNKKMEADANIQGVTHYLTS